MEFLSLMEFEPKGALRLMEFEPKGALSLKVGIGTSMSGGKSAGKPGLLGGVRGGDALLPRVGVRAPGDAERLPDPERAKLEPEEDPSLPLAWSASVNSFSRTRRSRSSSLSRSLQGFGFRVEVYFLSSSLQGLWFSVWGQSRFSLELPARCGGIGYQKEPSDASRRDAVCLCHGGVCLCHGGVCLCHGPLMLPQR
jgi:hypothetical protein